MKEERHVIWSKYGLDYEDWRDDLEADYPDLSEDERISLMYEINALRIQNARECLADSNCLIKDIPQKIGLENSQYFFQLFKKMTGKTPREYQNNLKILRKTEAAKQRRQL